MGLREHLAEATAKRVYEQRHSGAPWSDAEDTTRSLWIREFDEVIGFFLDALEYHTKDTLAEEEVRSLLEGLR